MRTVTITKRVTPEIGLYSFVTSLEGNTLDYLFIGIGGAFGALARYIIAKLTSRWWRGSFPVATFGINITGSFLLGFLIPVFQVLGPELSFLRNILATGFLGAYTTYSTFAYEIVNLFQDNKRDTALKYCLASIAAGILLSGAGFVLARFCLQEIH